MEYVFIRISWVLLAITYIVIFITWKFQRDNFKREKKRAAAINKEMDNLENKIIKTKVFSDAQDKEVNSISICIDKKDIN